MYIWYIFVTEAAHFNHLLFVLIYFSSCIVYWQ